MYNIPEVPQDNYWFVLPFLVASLLLVLITYIDERAAKRREELKHHQEYLRNRGQDGFDNE